MPKRKKDGLPPGVYQRFHRYYFMVRVPDPEKAGRTKQVWSQGFDTAEEAVIAQAEALLKKAKGERINSSSLAMREYLPAWLSSKRDLKQTTRHSYQRVIDGYLIPHLGDHAVGRVTPEHIDAMIDHLLTRGGAKGRPLAVATVRYAHTVLRYALNDAVKRRHITFNPATAVSPPKKDHGTAAPIRYWTREEVQTFFSAAGNHWIVPVVRFAVNTGMRRGELLGLRWSDLTDGYTHVTVAATRTSMGGTIVEGTTKSGKTRVFALGTSAREALRAIRAEQAAWRLRVGDGWRNTGDLVFTDEMGDPLAPWRVTNEFKRLVARTGVRPIRFHDLRHTNATLALSGGVRPDIVSQRLGHASVSFTIDTYGHVIPTDDVDAANVIDLAIN